MPSHRLRLGNLPARASIALVLCTLALGSPAAAQDDSSKGAVAPLIAQPSMNIVLSTSDIVEGSLWIALLAVASSVLPAASALRLQVATGLGRH